MLSVGVSVYLLTWRRWVCFTLLEFWLRLPFSFWASYSELHPILSLQFQSFVPGGDMCRAGVSAIRWIMSVGRSPYQSYVTVVWLVLTCTITPCVCIHSFDIYFRSSVICVSGSVINWDPPSSRAPSVVPHLRVSPTAPLPLKG